MSSVNRCWDCGELVQGGVCERPHEATGILLRGRVVGGYRAPWLADRRPAGKPMLAFLRAFGGAKRRSA